MSPIRLHHIPRTLPALAAGIITFGSEQGPTQPATLTFRAVSAGGYHACGVTAAGLAYCWGWNDRGQLGDGTTIDQHRPVRVAGGASYAAVSTRGGYTCGVTAAGAAYCWGSNSGGQLGDGTFDDRSSPVAVLGSLRFVAVSAGGDRHTCGATTAGAAYCWGRNERGQLGDATTTDRSKPVLVAGEVSFAAVSAGGSHTCGVTAAGAAYCWGSNVLGELGDGTTVEVRYTPVHVAQ